MGNSGTLISLLLYVCLICTQDFGSVESNKFYIILVQQKTQI